MADLKLNESKPVEKEALEQKPGFWRRQFQPEATYKQKRFDWIFGVIMPVVCFVLDPGIFRGGIYKGALFGTFKPSAYLLSFVLVMAMSAWLLWGRNFKIFNAFLSGLLALGGLVSLAIGLIISPLSVIGLLFIIGVLGFVPLLTSFVYLRAAMKSFDLAKPFLNTPALTGAFVLSVSLGFTIPMLINLRIDHLLEEMRTGDVATIETNARQLGYYAPLVNADKLAANYCDTLYGEGATGHPSKPFQNERQKALESAYLELTGHSQEGMNRAICLDW